ncbi:MAG: hypothetical protein NVS3B26_13970 [Mycobacteriales bacterium]
MLYRTALTSFLLCTPCHAGEPVRRSSPCYRPFRTGPVKFDAQLHGHQRGLWRRNLKRGGPMRKLARVQDVGHLVPFRYSRGSTPVLS